MVTLIGFLKAKLNYTHWREKPECLLRLFQPTKQRASKHMFRLYGEPRDKLAVFNSHET